MEAIGFLKICKHLFNFEAEPIDSLLKSANIY